MPHGDPCGAKVPKNQSGEFPKLFASAARYESKAPP